MAKKSAKRRPQPASRRPADTDRQAVASTMSRPAAATAARPSARPVQVAPAQSAADLANEYRYVLGDLRRVGILAASMFALLIVIALVAQFVIK